MTNCCSGSPKEVSFCERDLFVVFWRQVSSSEPSHSALCFECLHTTCSHHSNDEQLRIVIIMHCISQHNTSQHNTSQHNARQHNISQHNARQHNARQHNVSQHNISQHSTSQHKPVNMTSV